MTLFLSQYRAEEYTVYSFVWEEQKAREQLSYVTIIRAAGV